MNKRIKAIIGLLMLMLVLTIGISIWAVFFKEDRILIPDNINNVQNDDNLAGYDTGDPSNGEEAKTEENRISLTYSPNVEISLSNETVDLFFANPSKSNQDIVIYIAIQDKVICQSGAISPGYQLTRMDLNNASILTVGSYSGEMRAYCYDEKTGEKSMVNSVMPVNIEVVE